MDKWQAIQNFWSSYEIPAYDENSVPDDAVMPYITYSASVSSFENVVPLTASVWYNSTSWRDVSLKVDEIAKSLFPHKIVGIGDGEYMYLAQGDLFAQRMIEVDDRVKRIYINVMAEFFTAY